MQNILLLIKGLGRGGAEQLLLSAAPYLDHKRFRYEIAYLLPHKDALVPELAEVGIPAHCLHGAKGYRWLARLRKLIDDRDINLLHIHSPYAAIGARVALAGTRLPVVYTEHITWDSYHPLTYWGNLLTYWRNDHAFAVSDHVTQSVEFPRWLAPLQRRKIETLYHGLDFADFAKWSSQDGARAELGISDDAPVVGTVANIKQHKGYPHLLKAACSLRERLPNIRVVVVGTGPIEGEIHALANRLGLDDCVIFTGFREDAPRLVNAFDVFVLPSLQEGLSISLLEAMALGKPVVVTRTGGLSEVVTHDLNGLVVPPGDPGALVDSILEMLSDSDLRQRLGTAARTRAGDFDIRQAVLRQQQVYESLLTQ